MNEPTYVSFKNLLSRCVVRWLLAFVVCSLLFTSYRSNAQIPAVDGRFLTDSIEVGRPFQYALTFDHAPTVDVLFPDTIRQFSPFLVQQLVTFTTKTTGAGRRAVSRDSAVYTLVSFSVDPIQVLQVPVQQIARADSTTLMTQPDTVFLRSTLSRPGAVRPNAQVGLLATETDVLPLQQQFNYPLLGVSLLLAGILGFLVYGLFRRPIQRSLGLYQLNRRHIRFLREYNRLIRNLDSNTAPDCANQATVLWKTYLEKLEQRPYVSLTTSEIAERLADDRVADALREADRMIYGSGYSERSQAALRVLSDVATQSYQHWRDVLRG